MCLGFDLDIIRFRDVGNANHQHAHLSLRAMHDAWGDVDERALSDFVGPAVERYRSVAVQYVIEFGRDFVVVRFGAVDIDRVRPCGRCETGVFATDKTAPPSALAPLARRTVFMANNNRARICHVAIPPDPCCGEPIR